MGDTQGFELSLMFLMFGTVCLFAHFPYVSIYTSLVSAEEEYIVVVYLHKTGNASIQYSFVIREHL